MEELWPLVVLPVLVGIILLIIEYKTKWFARYTSGLEHTDRSRPYSAGNERSDLVVQLSSETINSTVPISELQSQAGDWLHIATKIAQSLQRQPPWSSDDPLELDSITEYDKGNAAELVFWSGSGSWLRETIVDIDKYGQVRSVRAGVEKID